MSRDEDAMAKMTLYRQTRVDGGVRTGLELDGLSALESFVPGSEDRDPVLLWFLDLRMRGDALNFGDMEEGRDWLLQHADAVTQVLNEAADRLASGMDRDYLPWNWETSLPDDVRVQVYVMAVHRLTAQRVGEYVRQFAQTWQEALQQLETYSNV
jgi:hypothetical protein